MPVVDLVAVQSMSCGEGLGIPCTEQRWSNDPTQVRVEGV